MNYGVPLFLRKKREKMPIDKIVNAGLGLLLQGHNDRRQVKQAGKLGNQQLGLDMQKMDHAQKLQKQMWDDTNYSAQVAHMKKAGLNPGLAYGMSGGGGQTVGSGGGGGSVGGAQAPAGGGEMMGMQLLGAQKALVEAQTEKTKAETEKTAGVDTDLTATQGKIAELERSMKHDTYEETYYKITAEADKAFAEATIAGETVDTEVKIRQGELIGIALANELKREKINLTDEQTKAMVEGVAQKWKDLELKEGKLNLDKFVNDVAASTRLTVETAAKVISNIVGMKGKTSTINHVKKGK